MMLHYAGRRRRQNWIDNERTKIIDEVLRLRTPDWSLEQEDEIIKKLSELRRENQQLIYETMAATHFLDEEEEVDQFYKAACAQQCLMNRCL